jgi:hypothetical protein
MWWTKRKCILPAGDEVPGISRCLMVAFCAGGRHWASPLTFLLFELQQPLGQFERECFVLRCTSDWKLDRCPNTPARRGRIRYVQASGFRLVHCSYCQS